MQNLNLEFRFSAGSLAQMNLLMVADALFTVLSCMAYPLNLSCIICQPRDQDTSGIPLFIKPADLLHQHGTEAL